MRRELLSGAFTIVLGHAALAAAEAPAESVEAPRPANPSWRPAVEAKRPIPFPAVLIAALDSSSYAERAAASRDLARSGPSAVPLLERAARSADLEVSTRAVAALESLWLRADDDEDWDVADLAQTALADLSDDGRPALAHRGANFFAAHQRRIEKRAVAEIRRRGGIVKFASDVFDIADDGSLRSKVERIVIGTAWTGGEEGLRHAKAVVLGQREIPAVKLYVIREAPLPPGTIERLEADLPPGTVQTRGAAYLGISCSSGGDCIVTAVEPNTPAAKSGLRAGDVLMLFDGRPVEGFDDLVEALKRVKVGGVVPVTALREGRPLELRVTMEEWK